MACWDGASDSAQLQAVSQTPMPFPTEPQFVARAEQALGRRLPSGYVARMLQANGGIVEVEGEEWVLHPIFDDSDQKRLKRTFNDIVRETGSATEWRGFPSDAVAIAANGLGDHLVFLPAKADDQFGDAVYIWNHETAELREIASDFVELDQAG